MLICRYIDRRFALVVDDPFHWLVFSFSVFALWRMMDQTMSGTFEVTTLLLYVGMFILAAALVLTMLLVDIAPLLTAAFSKTWVKAMDFFYLAAGIVGLVRIANSTPNANGQVLGFDRAGVLIVSAAFAVRLSKTVIEVFFDRQIERS